MTISFNPSLIQSANKYTPSRAQKFMKGIAEGGLSRFILLEAFVEAGRTYNAYQRGGKDEARERITEEFTAAVFWLGGVQFFNAIIDQIGKKILKLNDVDFHSGFDEARNPLKNFVYDHTKGCDASAIETFNKKISRFKGIKAITSVLLANIMIGFVVPKINQSITRYYHKNDNKINNQNDKFTPNTSMDKFIKDKNTVSFGTGALFNIANKLETDPTWQLLSQDIGTAGGRTISARNNDERREILIRDVGSIFFYMFNMPLVNMLMNKIEQDGRGSRADSINANYLKDTILTQMNQHLNKESLTPDELHEMLMGHSDILKNKEFKELLDNTFAQKVMNIDDFISKVPEFANKLGIKPDKYAKYIDAARNMSKLQPLIEGKALITKDQALKVFQGGMLNNPEFLKNLYEINYGSGKRIANFLNPYKYISNKSIESINDDLRYFAQTIIDKAKKSGKGITKEVLEKATKKNFGMNILNWGSGFFISALFLSTLIPKFQYWVTKQRTGENEFPGTKEFRK